MDWLYAPADWLNPSADWLNPRADYASPLADKASLPADKASHCVNWCLSIATTPKKPNITIWIYC